MLRRTRPPALLVTFYLFTGAATASAECAWVLWGVNTSRGIVVFPISAYQSAEECRREQAARDADKRSDSIFYNYLPDTVDPRGPKGK